MGDMRADEDRLPWLEPVEEEEGPKSSAPARLLVLLFAVLLLGAAGAYYWLGRDGAAAGDGSLIAAPAGPYKIKPADPGGMEVEGAGDTAFAASEGAEPRGRIDMSQVAETPLTAEEPAPRAPVADPPEEALDLIADTGIVQLGAFSSESAANAAWKALSARFSYLEPLAHSVVPVTQGERTLYRLRASGPGVAALCGRLRIAGENCDRIR